MCVRVKVKSPSGVEINTSIKTLRRKKSVTRMSQIFALKVYVTQFDRKLQNSGRMAIDERQSDQNDVNMTSNRRCLVDVFLGFFLQSRSLPIYEKAPQV